MDNQTRRDMETMAEWASTMDAYDRLLKRRARRRRLLHRFAYFKPWPVAAIDGPVVAEPAPEAPAFVSGVGSGAAGSETPPLPHTNRTGFVGPAGLPTVSVRPGTGRGPATPHLPPPLAARISAGITWT